MSLDSYKSLIVWQKAIHLVKEIFLITNTFPKSEMYGLTAQMRRAVVSIPSNIAEGYGRNSRKEYTQSLAIAYGSLLELETQLIIAKELQFISVPNYTKIDLLIQEIMKMLYVLRKKIIPKP